jgi:hypothetical protein
LIDSYVGINNADPEMVTGTRCVKLVQAYVGKPCLASGTDANTAVKVDKNGFFLIEMDW